MRLIHFSDLHLGIDNYGTIDPETGLSTRVLDFLRAFDVIVDRAIAERFDAVLFTGDAFKSAMGLKSNWFAVRGQASEPPPPQDCGTRTPPTVTGALPAAPGAEFTPIPPLRLIDTRSGIGTADVPLAGGCTLVIDPGLGDGVTAVAINVTAVRPALNGYLTAYPCGTPRPNVSAVQAISGRPVAGMAVVPLGGAGTICIFSSITTHLVVDLFGSYAPDSGVPFEPILVTA